MGKEILKKGDNIQVERIYPNAEPHKGTFEEMDNNGDYVIKRGDQQERRLIKTQSTNIMAKPRVFLSSTYYDLKHVRERIERFLANFGMEPVLFESDNVTFEFGKPLDLSCYNEVKTCHMMVLIVGGRYGSAATGEKLSQDRKDIYEQYVSITRKEHETATGVGIPSFVFIDKNVYAEYQTYKKNKKIFDDKIPFNFAHVDDINIFKFISILEPTTAIKTFDKVEEIENYLENQLSGMLFLYLQQLQKRRKDDEMLDAISSLENVSQRMNEMLSAIGRSILQDSGDYTHVIYNQNLIIFRFFRNLFYTNISFTRREPFMEIDKCRAVVKKIIDVLFDETFIVKLVSVDRYTESYWDMIGEINSIIERNDEKEKYIDEIDFNALQIITSNYIDNIYPIVKDNPSMKDEFYKILLDGSEAITGLPF